jgi:hypothetical protein
VTPLTKLKPLVLIQGGVVALGGLLFLLLDKKDLTPFLAGAALISVNFFLLALLWFRVLEKKTVAFTIGLVVIKYAILAVVLYVFIKEWNLPLLPLFMGLTTAGVSFVLYAVLGHMTQNKMRQ